MGFIIGMTLQGQSAGEPILERQIPRRWISDKKMPECDVCGKNPDGHFTILDKRVDRRLVLICHDCQNMIADSVYGGF